MTARSDAALERLSTVRTAENLLRYFIDELDWPLEDEALLEDEDEDEDVDDLTFDWELEELGVPRRTRARIERVRQIRPFTADQPWGIFFVELAGESEPWSEVGGGYGPRVVIGAAWPLSGRR